jgi:DNA-binding NarL/FixJ family response regulator
MKRRTVRHPDIARELFLSAHTVRTHVSHILAKLNAGSRVDIARMAERQRVDGSPRPG